MDTECTYEEFVEIILNDNKLGAEDYIRALIKKVKIYEQLHEHEKEFTQEFTSEKLYIITSSMLRDVIILLIKNTLLLDTIKQKLNN